MGLRSFHLFFMAISILLAAFVAAWANGQYRLEHEGIYLAWMIGAIGLGAALVIYARAFQRKTRHL
jgi:hypothetical protein